MKALFLVFHGFDEANGISKKNPTPNKSTKRVRFRRMYLLL